MRYVYSKGVVRKVQKAQTRFTNLTLALLFFATSLAGAAPLFLTGTAHATGSSNVYINEVMPNPSGGSEWVEVYSSTTSAIRLKNWYIKDAAGHQTNFANGDVLNNGQNYVTLDTNDLNNDGDTVTLYNDSNTAVDTATYGDFASKSGESFGRSPDGSSNFVTFTSDHVTKDTENYVNSALTTPTLAAENFNTVNDSAYQGISVGFNAKDFNNVSAVTVDITRADGTHAIKHGTADLYNLINSDAAPHQFTAPFVIQTGSYNPGTDSYWTSDAANWTDATTPTSATITVTGGNGTRTVTNTNFSAGAPSWPTYESLLPPQPPAAPTNLYWMQNGKHLECGGTTNSSIKPQLLLTAPSGPLYQYHVKPTYPSGSQGAYDSFPPITSPLQLYTHFAENGNGTYTYKVQAENHIYGQWSPYVTCSLNYDTQSPSAHFTQEPPKYVNSNFTVYGEATDNVKLKNVSFDVRNPNDTTGNSYRAGCVSGTLDVSWSSSDHKAATFKCEINVSSANLIDGQTYTLRVHVNDYAGYGGGESRDLTIDRDAPTVSVTPTAGSLLRGTETFNIKINDANPVSSSNKSIWVYVYNTSDGSKKIGAKVDLSSGSGTFTVNTKDLPDGNYNLDVGVVKDAAGNASGTSDNYFRNYTIDNTAPTIDFISPARFNDTVYNEYFSVGPNIAIAASDTNGIKDTVVHIHKADGSGAKYCPVSSSATNSCDASSLSQGSYYVTAAATDNAGNPVYVTKHFTIDTTNPTITVKDGYVGDKANNIFSNVSFKLHDNTLVDKYVINSHTVDLSNNTWSDANFQNIKGYLTEGSNTITLYDVAGNTSSYTFTYDSINPTGTVTYSPDTLTNGNVMATLTTSEPVQDISGWTKKSDTRFQKAYPKNDKTPNYDQTVTFKDLAENIGTAHVYIDWIDITAPSTPTGGLPNGTFEKTNEFDFTWDTSTDNLGPVTYEYQASQNPSESGGVLTTGLWHSGALSANTIHSSGAADGIWYWQVRAKDAAGNYSPWSTIWNMTIDSHAPDVTINTYSTAVNVITPDVTAADPTPGTALSYKWAANDAASASNVAISDDTVLEPDFTVNGSGTYHFTLTVTDAAGNSTSKTFDFTYAAPAPSLHTLAAPANGTQGNSGGTGAGATGTPGAGGFTNVTTGNPAGGIPQVLGAHTNKPNKDDGQVKGDQTALNNNDNKDKNISDSNAFLGLGWWWLLILAIIFGFFWFILGRRSNSTNKSV